MDAFINSFLLVFAGEMGDKTQLLALILAARFKRPWTILLGVFIATVLNHAAATYLGGWISSFVNPIWLNWILAALFIGFGLWILVPDKEEDCPETHHFGVLLTTITTFFMAEMGDKTQLATIALGARYQMPVIVTLATTLGMMASNALAIFLGPQLLKKIPMKWVRRVACALFLLMGLGLVVSMLIK